MDIASLIEAGSTSIVYLAAGGYWAACMVWGRVIQRQ